MGSCLYTLNFRREPVSICLVHTTNTEIHTVWYKVNCLSLHTAIVPMDEYLGNEKRATRRTTCMGMVGCSQFFC